MVRVHFVRIDYTPRQKQKKRHLREPNRHQLQVRKEYGPNTHSQRDDAAIRTAFAAMNAPISASLNGSVPAYVRVSLVRTVTNRQKLA